MLSKYLALSHIPPMMPKFFGYPYGGIPIFSFSGITFSLNVIANSGSAFGFFQGYAGLLFCLRVFMIAGLVRHAIMQRKEKTDWALGLIIAGAIGNGIDYIFYGHVIDFFHACFWGASFPIFNLGDCYITLGVLALLLFFRPLPKKEST